ncbi:flagellar brake protein [Desulfosporosinus sp. BG]|uniref:flagellar brake protein n=1 Tax=Desulfosporosinus sp. BG TaxID=1633135 RepID=UPI00083A1E93|nr:flagellar brake protein [Desulfosporosinus sp. BG]ODA42503.1 Flagellar protein [Desulfosporosinus sp. BG]
MTYKKKLLPGLIAELIVQEGEYEGKYRTRIEEVGERLLSVGAPFEHGEVVPLREGTKVKLIFWDEVSAYSFVARIMQRIAAPIHLFVLELPDSILKVQRRNYVRVPALYPITFQTVTKEGLSDSYKGTMLDLSGGGIRFLTEECVENRSILYFQVGLPNGDLRAPVLVCRAEKLEDSKPQRYCISTEFHEILERDRDRVIRCVFDIQRAMRKKGLV